MSMKWIAAALAVALAPSLSGSEKPEAQFKSVEIKHFALAEGVELSAEFPDFLYAELKAELEKSKLFGQVLGEGEFVEPAEADRSVVLQGSLLEYKKGNVAKEAIIGFGAGRRSLRANVALHRLSNNESLFEKELKIASSSRLDEKKLARDLAKKIVGELKGKFRQ